LLGRRCGRLWSYRAVRKNKRVRTPGHELFPSHAWRQPLLQPTNNYRCPSAKQPSPITMSTDHYPAETERTLDATSTASVGCVECRTRRLHCETDAANPRQACGSCIRNGYICSNLTSTATAPRPPRPTAQNRVQKAKDRAPKRVACDWCRRQKVRCSGESPCSACAIRDQSCVYPSVNNGQPNLDSPATQASRSQYDTPIHGHPHGSSSLNLQPAQIHQAPASMPRLHVPRLVPDTIKHDY
jgi:hypothetical protein